jgi:hypothetical protein
MNFLRNMDLYTAIVLVSLLLLPAGAWWTVKIEEDIELCKDAIRQATKNNGLLEEIGSLQKKVDVVMQNRTNASDAINMPGRYFQGQIIAAAAGGSLNTNDFSLSDPKDEPVQMGKSKQRAADYVVDVTWSRKDFAVSLDFIYAVVFNCESGASGVGQGQPSIWKLRNLQIVNATVERSSTQSKTPPPELEDKWIIREMKFARREPRKGG